MGEKYDGRQSPTLRVTTKEREVFLPEEREPRKPTWQQKIAASLRIRNDYIRILLSEFLGIFILVTFGVSCVAQFVLNSSNFRFNVVAVNLGWGIAVALGVFVSGEASGGHINPAITVAFAVLGRTPWRKVPFYFMGQYLGAFFGALVVYLAYQNALDICDHGIRQGPYSENITCSTAGIWATYPQSELIATWQGFVDQIFSTGLLMLMVMAITDKRNMEVPKGLIPIAIGLTILGLTTGFESNCGAAMNPARDLSPRIFTALSGWGGGVFSYRNFNWFWVPVLGPHIGAIFGAWFYNICVGLHWPPLEDTYRLR